jgi:hypothetical protein
MMNESIPDTSEFVRAVFKPGGREYTYLAKPGELAIGDEAQSSGGKTLIIVAVKASAAIVNGKPLPLNAYGWVGKKAVEVAVKNNAGEA